MFRSLTPLIEDNPARLLYGCTAGDFDGDGRTELFVCGFGSANSVLRWHEGKLIETVCDRVADLGRRAVSACAADVDGDGIEELFVAHAEGEPRRTVLPDRLWKVRDGLWTDLLHGLPAPARYSSRAVGAVDRRGDGRPGLFVANHDGPLQFLEWTNEIGLVDRAAELGIRAEGIGRGVLVGPITGTRPDVLVTFEGRRNAFFACDAAGNFTECAARLGIAGEFSSNRGAALLNYAEEGRLDIAVGSWQRRNRIWVAGEDGIYTDAAFADFAASANVRSVIVADFDNCGHEEVFLHCLGGPNHLFGIRNGSWQELDPGDAAEPEGTGTAGVVADLNGDGVTELLLAHGETEAQPLTLHRADAHGNGWLRIQPLTRAGAPARGAKVVLEHGGRRQARVIDGGSGYLCQMEPVAHFGLGASDYPCSVTITWPDGSQRVIGPLQPRSSLQVPHPGAH